MFFGIDEVKKTKTKTKTTTTKKKNPLYSRGREYQILSVNGAFLTILSIIHKHQ